MFQTSAWGGHILMERSRLGSTFVDGGVHPRFGTRNFTMPLQKGRYIEVVCPLDHPATEQTPLLQKRCIKLSTQSNQFW